MSKYEQLKQVVNQVKQEAARKRVETERFQLEQKQKRLSEQQAQEDHLRRCKENWPAVREHIVQTFQDINEEALGHQGIIVPWRRVKTRHNHTEVVDSPGRGSPGSFRFDFRYVVKSEIAELNLGSAGKITAIKELRSTYKAKERLDMERFPPIINNEPSDLVIIGLSDRQETLCKHCFSFRYESIHLDAQPEEILAKVERLVSKKVESLLTKHY